MHIYYDFQPKNSLTTPPPENRGRGEVMVPTMWATDTFTDLRIHLLYSP